MEHTSYKYIHSAVSVLQESKTGTFHTDGMMYVAFGENSGDPTSFFTTTKKR